MLQKFIISLSPWILQRAIDRLLKKLMCFFVSTAVLVFISGLAAVGTGG
jgi:hypothetical protein